MTNESSTSTTSHKELIHNILKQYWGYDSFRPLQEEIILSVLENRDTLALLPTGGGKSICFQVPALAKEGLCIVISPLIALMKDQVEHLKRRHVPAAAIYSGMSQRDIDRIIDNAMFDKQMKFLYVSPERLKTDKFRACFQRMNVSMFAVDEAHCISQWGYDFRPPYLEIAEIRKYFPNAPVLALTATATTEVVKDIQQKLNFRQENLFQKSFRRDNLTYYIVKEEDKRGRMLRIMQRYPGTGVVYVRNRRRTREVAEFLVKNGISADFYHAGLDSETRDRKQNDWMTDKTRVIVSTNAFGMGIDKPTVRFVIHLDIPDTLEAYFQEAGRGGRDEQPAIAVMLYDNHDLGELRKNFELSFPPVETIKNVYKQLVNHFKIPLGSGAGWAVPFEIVQFAKIFKMNLTELYNSIKFLEKTGLISFIEDENRVSTLSVIADNQALRLLERSQPKLDEFLKLILRSYSGVFTNVVKISEAELAQRADNQEDTVIEWLQELHHKNIISYHQKTMKPTLLFVENRIKEDYIYLAPKIYQKRKDCAENRLKSVENYVKDAEKCRSRLLLQYFGEMKSVDCGKCDNCLKMNKLRLSNAEFETIKKVVFEHLSQQDWALKALIFALSTQFKEEKVVEAVRWLIDHDKIQMENATLLKINEL